MSTFSSKDELYSNLKTAITVLMQGQDISFLDLPDKMELICETPTDSVGFALIGDNQEEEYDTAYSMFKQLYHKYHAIWKEKSLSFVVCFLEMNKQKEIIANQIEQDVYFCRKYILYHLKDEENIQRELLKLPFFPIVENKTSGIVRPPSAQTFLSNLGVSSTLARQLVVPREKAADWFVNELYNISENLPEIGGGISSQGIQSYQSNEHTRIKSISIENFRAYRKKQHFDTDADIVVLYGPNGLGKTSFFDAIDFVCTGRIGRLCNHSTSKEDFIGIARHLNSTQDAGTVTLDLLKDEKEYQIVRNVSDWSNTLINNKKYDRGDTLQFLTSAIWGEKKERIEILERLFRATHLFSQTAPELLIEFEKESKLSADLVSRMLTLEDYVMGNKKIQDIFNNVKKQLINENENLKKIINESNDLIQQIKKIPKNKDSINLGPQLKDMAKELLNSIHENSEIEIINNSSDLKSVREWRSLIEAEFINNKELFTKLQTIETGISQYQKNQDTYKEKSDICKRIEYDIKNNDEMKRRINQDYGITSDEIKKSKKELSELNKFKKDFFEYKEIGSQIKNKKEQIDSNAIKELQIEKSVEELTSKVDENKNELTKLSLKNSEQNILIIDKTNRISLIRNFSEDLLRFESCISKVSLMGEEVKRNIQKINEYDTILQDKKERIKKLQSDLIIKDSLYNNYSTEHSELTRLLDEIESHVKNGVCPTCGFNHESKEELIKKIHSNKENRPLYINDLSKECNTIRESIDDLESSYSIAIKEQEHIKEENKNLDKELNELKKSQEEYYSYIEKLNLKNEENVKGKLEELLNNEIIAQDQIKKEYDDLIREKDILNKQIQEAELKLRYYYETAKKIADDQKELNQQVLNLHLRMEELKLTFGSSFDINTTEKKIVELEKTIEELIIKEKNINNKMNEVDDKSKNLILDLKTIQEEMGELYRNIDLFQEEVLGSLGLEAISKEKIVVLKKKTSDKREKLKMLLSKANTVERAMDSVQRSAILSELTAKEHELQIQKQESEYKIRKLNLVYKWLMEVGSLLRDFSSEIVNDYVKAFGPLTTLIQRRLRAVYGFGEVRLQPLDSEIHVEVDWEGRIVKPTDYFSDSQKQILMLSLFMSERLTQTWSSFSPILMDDPVTHFDDLNSFGFVELIRGLVTTSPGKWQFFISTCEERLFELMKQKFSRIKNVRFYRYIGINDEGPTIKMIEPY